MMTNDETMLMSGRQVANTQSKKEDTPVKAKKSNGSWKKVMLGGTAGILVGAGALYATNAFGTEDSNENNANVDSQQPEDVKVAKVSDDQSFTDAFNSARAEVGPGGVFRWHGGLYSTYKEDEWNALSDEDKAEFTQAVRPEVRADEIVAERMSDDAVHTHSTAHDMHNAASDDVQIVTPNSSNDGSAVNIADQQTDDPNDGDVYVVGQGYVEGHQAVALDLTGNGEADVAVIDVNDNNQLDDPDVIVDTDGNYATIGDLYQGQDVQTVDDSYAYTSDSVDTDPNTDPNFQQASYDNPDLSPDMPDYMNDADVSGQLV